MTTSYIKHISFFCVLFCGNFLLAQEHLTGYLQPQIALNYKVTPHYGHHFSVIERTYIFDDEQIEFKAKQLDIAHYSKLKINHNQSLSFGILYRFLKTFDADQHNELRLTQQYNIAFKPNNIQFAHRIRSEQRIKPNLTTHRFRYRFAANMPLQGEQLDVGEPYCTGSLESLLSIASGKKPQYDQRFTANLGWQLNEKIKWQAGLEYRFENYTNTTEHVFFVLTSLIVSL